MVEVYKDARGEPLDSERKVRGPHLPALSRMENISSTPAGACRQGAVREPGGGAKVDQIKDELTALEAVRYRLGGRPGQAGILGKDYPGVLIELSFPEFLQQVGTNGIREKPLISLKPAESTFVEFMTMVFDMLFGIAQIILSAGRETEEDTPDSTGKSLRESSKSSTSG